MIGTMSVLYSWLGMSDLRLMSEGGEPGPIAQALFQDNYSELVLISNSDAERCNAYLHALESLLALSGAKKCPKFDLRGVELEDPTDYADIFHLVRGILDSRRQDEGRRVFHLSPGTPAMASVWMVISQSSHPARLIQSSRQRGVKTVQLPFSILASERNSLSEVVQQMMVRKLPGQREFSAIIHRDASMQRLIVRARKVAAFDIPVLITGESGTGKELLCQAIHQSGSRSSRPFLAVNCGAIPSELMESQFFGHTKGAFTGADKEALGYFRQADGGTLFLDEIGELPLSLQVKLLRVLQDASVTPLGSSRAFPVDVRIIAATNRNLERESAAGNFRQDLFYRLAVAQLHIPPLRQRRDDVSLLARGLLAQVNRDFRRFDESWQDRDLNSTAISAIENYAWPGNVRQLINCLKQAALWSEEILLSEQDILDALPDYQATTAKSAPGESESTTEPPQTTVAFSETTPSRFEVLPNTPEHSIGDLQEKIDELSREEILKALRQNKGHRGKTAQQLGFANHQTLSNWMSRLGIDYNGPR